MQPASRVFTIPASAPFLPTLIRALAAGRLVEGFPDSDPLALGHATLFLPTRRAARLMSEIFLDVIGREAAALPRIVVIGDVDEDELAFADTAGPAMLDLPPALGVFERRMLLARLILKWAEQLEPATPGEPPLIVHGPAAALALADDLARLIDDMTTRQVGWEELDGLVPDNLDPYWQITLRFLKVARETWPAILAERGAIDPAAHRDLLIEAERIRLSAMAGPVIAAGSTGSMPATAKLLATIAALPRGALVLPGLDTDLDDDAWALIAGVPDQTVLAAPPAHSHPQSAMQALLGRIGIERSDVCVLGEPHPRSRLVSEAMRPAAATERWALPVDEAARQAALERLAVIEAANVEDEALAIAVALRETLETPGKSAALVTPDRALARRVVAALGRWKIAVDDSGGDALGETEAGVFARLAAEMALEGLPPVKLLALVKHARFRLGAARDAHRRAISALERAVLRGPRPRPGTAGLVQALGSFRGELARLRRDESSELHRSDPRTDLADEDLDAAEALAAQLTRALVPLEGLTQRAQPFAMIAARHRDALAALSKDDAGTELAFFGDDGAKLAAAFDEIAKIAAAGELDVARADYAQLFTAAISDRVVHRTPAAARVRVFGPLEARLVSVDRVVLGGLTEGTWPPEVRPDPWLSRPMRRDLGLDLPERRIGLSAHDFAQLLGAPEAILTHSAKLAGAPTVASRFTQRLAAVAGEAHWRAARARGERYLHWARALDRPDEIRPARRPQPKPPVAARPRRLSVTEIEHWLRDPYTIYAKHILRLRPLDPVDLAPGARDRGIVIHGAIGEFTERFARALPEDPLAELMALGEKHFAPLRDYPEARAFWWPRFVRIARWFVDFEAERRTAAAAVHAEVRGEIVIPLGERTFVLTARADRIEEVAGGYAILDYKTGQIPTEKQVRSGLTPQLTLEGAILRRGGFKPLAGGALTELAYVALKGGEPAGRTEAIDFKEGFADSQADKALARLAALVARFEDPATPYNSLVSPMWKRRYGDYDHLARVKEWSTIGEDDDEGDEG